MMNVKLWVLPILLLCLSVSSWGACNTFGTGESMSVLCGGMSNAYCAEQSGSEVTECGSGSYFAGAVVTSYTCRGYPSFGYCYYNTTCCSTQAEADSATIAQKCATGTMVKDTVGDTIFDACQNGEGLLIAFNNPITGVHNASIGYYIVTDDSADSLDEATYNHLASLACTEVSLYRGVLNGKYVYWYSTDPEPAGVVNVVRIK